MVELDPGLYTVVWLAPLEIEAQAALHMLDHQHKGKFSIGRGDDYVFQAGDICGHNIVIATLPAGQEYGTGSAAALASQVKWFFPNLWFGLLVGVAAGLPNLSRSPPLDIRLGDVLVGLPEGESAGLIAYDLGKETGKDGLQLLLSGHVLAKTETVVRSAIGSIKLKAPNDTEAFLMYYEHIKDKTHTNGTFIDPGQENDNFYEADDDGAEHLVQREQRPDDKRTRVWYGPIGTGDKLMKNSRKRNELRDKYNIIGLEMEAAGVMNRIPVGVIRGVCDYGDEHKNKDWQPYAAAMAAAYSKAVLAEIPPKSVIQGKEPTEQNLPLWLFDPNAQEAKKSRAEFLHCQDPHDSSEALRGFSNTTTFLAWARRTGSLLWCQTAPRNASFTHPTTAACIMRYAMSAQLLESSKEFCGKQPVEVFYYKCSTAPPVSIPKEYGEELEDKEFETDFQGTVNESKSQMFAPELMLRAFIAQATRMRSSPLHEYARAFDASKTAFENLKQLFISLISCRKGRTFLVVDDLQHLQFRIAELLETLGEISSQSTVSNCSVLVGGDPTAVLSEALQNVPSVNLNSEYQECCESLAVEGSHARRDEIAPAIQGTNEWIWYHPRFQTWRSQPGGSIAIIGKPGSGKSVLAKHVTTKLQNHCDSGRSGKHSTASMISAWFYSKRSGEQFVRHEILLRSLLQEFLAKDAALFDQYKPLYRAALPSSHRVWTVKEMEALMKSLASSTQPFLIVIDAVDEAVDDSILRLVESLSQIPGSHMKFIVLTRPVRLLDRKFWQARKIVLQNENHRDIRRVVVKRCDRLKSLLHETDADMDLDSDSNDSGSGGSDIAMTVETTSPDRGLSIQHATLEELEFQQLCDTIIEQSEGVILWVKLVFDSLCQMLEREGFLSLSEIHERAKQMPIGLDAFYAQFVRELQERHNENGLEKVRRALMWISAGSEIKPFTLGELCDALAIPETEFQLQDLGKSRYNPIDRNRIPANSWSGRRRIIEKLCGPFVEVIWSPNGKDETSDSLAVVQLMHQTVKDFLTNSENAGKLRFHSKEASSMVQRSAIQYINIMLPASPCEYAPIPFREDTHLEDGVDAAIDYLEELRLVDFCVMLAKNNTTVKSAIQEQARLAILHGFLPAQGTQGPKYSHPQLAQFDFNIDRFTQVVVMRFFREATRRGMSRSVKAMLSLSTLVERWWHTHGHSARNATLFTVFDHFLDQTSSDKHYDKDIRGMNRRERLAPAGIREATCQVMDWRVFSDVGHDNKCTIGSIEASLGVMDGRTLPKLVRKGDQKDQKANFIDGLVTNGADLLDDIWSGYPTKNTRPLLPLRVFIQETLRRSRTSYSTCQLALYYLVLLKVRALDSPEILAELSSMGMLERVCDSRRMFLASLLVASKYLQDRNYSTRAWSKISGLGVKEISAVEWAFLKAIGFNLHPSDEQFTWWDGILVGLSRGTLTNEELWSFLEPVKQTSSSGGSTEPRDGDPEKRRLGLLPLHVLAQSTVDTQQ